MIGWHRLSQEVGPDLKIQWGGTVQWAGNDDDADKLRSKAAQREKLGYPVRLIDSCDIARLEPGVETGPVRAATFTDVEGTLDPLHATGVLLARAKRLGAKLICPCETLSIAAKGDAIDSVLTSQGRMTADSYVIAAGFATTELVRQVDVDAPLVQARGVLAHTKPMSRVLDRVLVLPAGGVSIKQDPDGRIVTGAHFAGYGTLDPSREVGERMLAEATRHVPRLAKAKLDFVTLGYAAMRKDGLPVAGLVRGKRNLFVAAMNSGITLAPIIGQLAGIEVLDDVATDVLDPCRA